MVTSSSFADDLKLGQFFERKVFDEYYKCESFKVEFPPDIKFSDYDFKIIQENGEEIKYEVKTDFQCYKTNNFFIETHGRKNQKTGLFASRADKFILIKASPDKKQILEVFEIDTFDLISLQTKCREIKSRDGNSGFLLNINLLREFLS